MPSALIDCPTTECWDRTQNYVQTGKKNHLLTKKLIQLPINTQLRQIITVLVLPQFTHTCSIMLHISSTRKFPTHIIKIIIMLDCFLYKKRTKKKLKNNMLYASQRRPCECYVELCSTYLNLLKSEFNLTNACTEI